MLRWVAIAARGARRTTSGKIPPKILPFRTLVSSPKDPGASQEGPSARDIPFASQVEAPPKVAAQDSAEQSTASWDATLGSASQGEASPQATVQDSAEQGTASWDPTLKPQPPADEGGSGKTHADHSASSQAYEAASMAYTDAGGKVRMRRREKGGGEYYGDGAARMASMRDSGALYLMRGPKFSADSYLLTKRAGSQPFTDIEAVGVLIRKKLQPSLDKGIEYVNERSGWAEVERLKGAISTLELNLREAQGAHREVREKLKTLQERHRRSQVEMDTLLVTKHMWSEEQLHQYQKLLNEERMNSAAMQGLELAYSNTEHKVDTSLNFLMEGLRKRFHEEQLWTDRIRQLSTWSTIAILMANSLIFMFTYLLRWREVNNVRTAVAQIRKDVQHQDLASKSMCAQVDEMNEHLQRMEELLDRSQQLLGTHANSASSLANPDADAWAGGQAGMTRKQKSTGVAWFVGTAVLAAWVLGRQFTASA